MAKMILSMDGLVLKEIPIGKERMTIGRKPHNDIQIDNLAVSGEHAVIVTILNDSFLEDLGSTNGTLVNGQPIKKHFLQHNDVVELGKYKLKYVNEQSAHPRPVQDFEKTMVLRPGQAVPRPAAVAVAESQGARAATATSGAVSVAQPAPVLSESQALRANAAAPAMSASQGMAGAGRMAGAVQILSGANAGRELELVKPLTTIGRAGAQTAVITRRPNGYFITHVEGASFPVVNGTTLDGHPHPLADHDVIEIAGVKMEFFLKG
jgi:pSer/pThr/pTyr-binding forkhead associated (FHA) protein